VSYGFSMLTLTSFQRQQGVRKHQFGEGLELPEQEWLVSEINAHLAAIAGMLRYDETANDDNGGGL